MTTPIDRPVSDDVLARFAAYHRSYPNWGSLLSVLRAGDIMDSSVAFCRQYALWVGDNEGYSLACIIGRCDDEQRRNLTHLIADFEKRRAA